MKKAIQWYISVVLSEFKLYRKKKGGTWYYVHDPESGGGFESTIIYWTIDPADLEVLKTETYGLTNKK